MRNFFACFLIIFLTFGLVINEASAKRFGSGRSFGVQRSSNSLSQTPAKSYTPYSSGYNRGQQATPSRWGKWGGMLGGLLVGGLLASLFMGHGIGSGILSWLLIAVAIYVVFALFRRFMQPSPSYQSASPTQDSQPGMFRQAFDNYTNTNNQASNNYPNNNHPDNNYQNNNYSNSNYPMQDNNMNYPPDFSREEFLADARAKFTRLQAAFDQQNISDLSSFTTPEMFAEVKSQLQERGNQPNRTEIISLNAELLDVSKQFDSLLASVRFTGTLKENNDPLTQLNEIWHFCRYTNSNKWVVAGVQQDVIEPR